MLRLAVAFLAALLLSAAVPAAAQHDHGTPPQAGRPPDSDAPPGAPPHYIPDARWAKPSGRLPNTLTRPCLELAPILHMSLTEAGPAGA